MRRAVLLAEDDIIGESCINFSSGGLFENERAGSFPTLKESVKELEKRLIKSAMDSSAGNKTRAAEMLGISYKNLFDKLKEYNIK